MLDVLPPSDVALERDVLAIALMNGRPPNVSPEVFYDTNNRMVKVAMEKVASSRIEMDLVSLLDAIDPKYHDYLVEICDHRSGVSTVNEEYHENRLIKIYNQRELVRLGHFIINTAQKTNCDVEALVANIRNACGVLGDPRDKDSIMIGEINQAMVEKAIGALDSPVETVGIKSGLPKLDRVLLGFQGGKLYIIAARPSVGKSALGHNVILQAARDGHQVLIFSAEMNREAVWYREMAGLTGISTTALKTGRSPSNEKAIVGGGQVIEGLPIRIFDGSRVTEQTVSAAAAKFQPDLVVIDYLQRMRSSMPKKDRHDLEIGHISWSLKNLAEDLNIPVVLLAQLNRKADDREKPVLRDLKESGSIEEDADVVIMLWRERMILLEDEKFTPGEIMIRKNRDGEQRIIRAQYWPYHCQWREQTSWEEE